MKSIASLSQMKFRLGSTCWQVRDKEIVALTNGTTLFKHRLNLAKYPIVTAKILHRDMFWFFIKDEDFVSRTISDGSIDLDKFPASRVWQLTKKLESSKPTARHIKQVSGEPQATQINLLRDQRTDIPPNCYKKKRSHIKPRPSKNKPHAQEHHQTQVPHKKKGDHRPVPPSNPNRCSKCGDTTHCEGFTCPAKKYQCKICHKFGHFTSQCFQKKQQSHYKHRQSKAHLHTWSQILLINWNNTIQEISIWGQE